MSAEEQSRELNTQERHHEEHQHESMRMRKQVEVHKPSTEDDTEEQARELNTQERQSKEHQQAAMLNRAEAEVGISGKNPAAAGSQE